MQQALATGITRRELMIFFYKFRTRLGLSLLIPIVLTIGIALAMVPRYKAESVMVVRLGSEYVYQPETGNTVTGDNRTIPFDRDQIFKSEVAILNSDDLHKEAIEAVGLGKLYPEIAGATTPSMAEADIAPYKLAKAAEAFGKRFDIRLEKDSAVITASFEHPDRALATATLQSLLTLYFEKRKLLYLEPRAGMAETQMSASRLQVQKAQEAVTAFKQKYKLYSLEEQRKQLLDKLSDAERRAIAISSASLNGEIGGYRKKLDALDKQEKEFIALQKEAELANEAYSLTTRRYNEAQAYEDVQNERTSSVRVIQPPSAQTEPHRMRLLVVLAGGVLSLLAVLATAGFCEMTRRGFLTPEEVERHLKLPVLAAVAKK